MAQVKSCREPQLTIGNWALRTLSRTQSQPSEPAKILTKTSAACPVVASLHFLQPRSGALEVASARCKPVGGCGGRDDHALMRVIENINQADEAPPGVVSLASKHWHPLNEDRLKTPGQSQVVGRSKRGFAKPRESEPRGAACGHGHVQDAALNLDILR